MCEGNCVIEQSGHGTVTIGSVEKYITDTAWAEGWVTPAAADAGTQLKPLGSSVPGPAGWRRRMCCGAPVCRSRCTTGTTAAAGLLTYGIPGFKLEKDVVMRRIEQLEQGGVEFVMNCNVGEDIQFDELRNKHNALIIATGVYKSRDLQGPGIGRIGHRAGD